MADPQHISFEDFSVNDDYNNLNSDGSLVAEVYAYNNTGWSGSSYPGPEQAAVQVQDGDVLIIAATFYVPSGATPVVEFGTVSYDGDDIPSLTADGSWGSYILATFRHGDYWTRVWARRIGDSSIPVDAGSTGTTIGIRVSGLPTTTDDGRLVFQPGGGHFYFNVLRNTSVDRLSIAYDQSCGPDLPLVVPSRPQFCVHYLFGRSAAGSYPYDYPVADPSGLSGRPSLGGVADARYNGSALAWLDDGDTSLLHNAFYAAWEPWHPFGSSPDPFTGWMTNEGHAVTGVLFGININGDYTPDVEGCELKYIAWATPIDIDGDNGDTSVGYGDKGIWLASDGSAPGSDHIAAGDLLVAAMTIYAPHQDPQLFLGHFEGGDTRRPFTDHTSEWNRLGPFRNDDIWAVVYWKIASELDAELGSWAQNGSMDYVLVNGNIYTPTNDGSGGSGFLTVWSSARSAYIEYNVHTEGTDHIPPETGHTIQHMFFGREPGGYTGSQNTKIQPGNLGLTGSIIPTYRHWHATWLNDTRVLSGGSYNPTEAYGEGIVCLDGGPNDIPFEKFTTWNPTTGILLGIRIVCNQDILICFV